MNPENNTPPQAPAPFAPNTPPPPPTGMDTPPPVFGGSPPPPSHAPQHPVGQPSNPMLKYVIIGVVALVVIIVGVAAYFLWGRQNSPSTSNNNSQSQPSGPVEYSSLKTTEPLKDGKLTLSPQFVATEAIQTQTVTAKVGDQINMSDGISFAVSKVERGWVAPTGSKPRSGNEFVALTILYGNRDAEDSQYFSATALKLHDSTGKEQYDSFVTPLSKDGNFPSEPLEPGEQRTGILVFEVKIGEAPLDVFYDEAYISSESGNVKLKATVDL